jgi:hypothetical protein
VDDTKISHEDHKVVTCVITKIETKFGKMMVTRGKDHIFLGMNIIFHGDGTASIKMKDYIKEAITDFSDDITRTATTAAKKNLFDIDEDGEPLGTKARENFHRQHRG